jgi:hypothetical protein
MAFDAAKSALVQAEEWAIKPSGTDVLKKTFSRKINLFEKTLAVRSIDAQLTGKEVVLSHMTVVAVGAPVMLP